MTKFNDTQLTILSAAGGRENGLVLPFPKSLKLTAAKTTTTIRTMLRAGLISERPAVDGEAIWRTDEGTGKLTIVISDEGLRAIGIEPAQAVADSSQDKPVRRNVPGKPGSVRSAVRRPKGSSTKATKTSPAASEVQGQKPGTKLALMIAALHSGKGATINDLTNATGWQPHSVRGAMSGALKKKKGLNVTSTAVDGRGRVYRIT